MTSAEAKAYLTRARDAERDIVLLDDDCRWAMDSIANLKRIQSHNDLAPAIDRLKHYARNIDRKRKTAQFVRKRASALIDLVPDARAREILRRRYMERQTWEQIGEALCYDVRYCSRLHNKALASAAFT
mgnify:CR=1 FL=1